MVLLRRAVLPPILDAGSRRSVMTSSAVLSTSVQPMQELVQQGGLGDVCITSMFGDQSRSPVLGRQRRQVAETVKVFQSLHLPRRQTFSMETSTHPSQDQVLSMRDPRKSSRSLERSRADLAACERCRVFLVNAHVHTPIRHSLVINLVVFQICCQGLETRSMVVCSQQSEGRRLTCSLISRNHNLLARSVAEAMRV